MIEKCYLVYFVFLRIKLTFVSQTINSKNMKHKVVKMVVAGIMAITSLYGQRTMASEIEGRVTILIRHIPSDAPEAPRSSSSSVVEAEYDDVLNSVVASLSNAGAVVDVSIENLTTGETYYDRVSGSGMSILPISGSSGCWRLTFTLGSGDAFVGEFEL